MAWKKLKQGIQQQIEDISTATRIMGEGATSASNIVQETVDQNIEFIKSQHAEAQSYLTPFYSAGQTSLNELQALLGLSGTEAEQAATDRVLQGAAVQESIKLGTEEATRAAAASGMTQSGNFAVELQDRGQAIATSSIADRQNMLFNLTQSGQQAAGALSLLSTQLGTDVSNQANIGAEARANAALVSSQAMAEGILAQSPLKAALISPSLFAGGLTGGSGGGASYGSAGALSGGILGGSSTSNAYAGTAARFVQDGLSNYFVQPNGEIVGGSGGTGGVQ